MLSCLLAHVALVGLDGGLHHEAVGDEDLVHVDVVGQRLQGVHHLQLVQTVVDRTGSSTF